MEQEKAPTSGQEVNAGLFNGLVEKLRALRDTAPEGARIDDQKVEEVAKRMFAKAERDGREITQDDLTNFEKSWLFNEATEFVAIKEHEKGENAFYVQDTETGEVVAGARNEVEVRQKTREQGGEARI